MSFLQPGLLLALPMIALPVIIHLINRQRHRTVSWGAMMFLLDAKKMTRGMAKLRQWIILLMRMLAVAGLIFALSRPLAGLWFGSVAGGVTDTTIILLDRSASMEQQNLQTGLSKRATALNKLSEMLEKTNRGTRVVLIESANLDPIELDFKDDLTSLPQTGPTSTSTDIPALLERGIEYIDANQSGRTDVWLCTDMRANDWDAVSGRWEAVRSRASLLK
ncbi:MAG: BatA domain-containing protein [Opitutales bacterium]|nr:BatA domain-containing protein [Opitutales bacterium]